MKRLLIPTIFLTLTAGCGDIVVRPDDGVEDVMTDTSSDAIADAVTNDSVTGGDAARDMESPDDVSVSDVETDTPGNDAYDDTEAFDDASDDVDEPDAGDDIDTFDATDTGPLDTYTPPDIPEQGEFTASGFFRVQAHDGRWWFVTPDGKPMYSVGINACTPNGSVDASTGDNRYKTAVTEKYEGDTWSEKAENWATSTVGRLESWGFNTIGAWSDYGRLGSLMPYTVILNISGVDWQVGDIPDYFSDEFAARCRDVAAKTVAPRKEDQNLIGWFLDNELRWGWDWRSPKTLLEDYLAMPDDTPGRKIAEGYRGDPEGFLKAVASQYFFTTTTAVRDADPNHLILGIRSISVMTHPQVPQAAGPWVDVYSVNNYEFLPELYESIDAAGQDFTDETDWLVHYYEITGRPILITEYSMRSAEADVPSTWPVFYPVYETQADRAKAWEAYTRNCFAKPYIIGQHWFQWVDEPAGGRFDGENSNFGLVDGDDNEYTTLVETMTTVNAEAPDRIYRQNGDDR